MSHGRKPKGRPAHLNPGRVTRTITRLSASQGPGAGVWRRSHADKVPFPLFCEALKMERTARRTRSLDGNRIPRRQTYPCTYGHHHLISGPAHWHIGRPV
jgi:hypothetical protein